MALHQIVQAHGSATVEQFDGVTFRYPDWWFNVRPFASQRIVHVTLEARSRKIVDQKLTELQPLLGERT
jgi:phosphomannomutase